MKENSIEETIKQLKLILKIRKEQKEIIECAGGSCINCDPDIEALTNSIDILSDYKRVLEENEELRDKYATFVKMSSEVIANSIPVQKVKDKIEELKEKSGGNVFHIQQAINAEIRLLKELIEKREEK